MLNQKRLKNQQTKSLNLILWNLWVLIKNQRHGKNNTKEGKGLDRKNYKF